MAIYSKGKRTKKTKLTKGKVILIVILLLIIIAAIVYLIISNMDFNEQEENIIGTSNVENNEEVINNVIEEKPVEDETVDVSNIPDKISGYEVVGKLVIDKIGVSQNILAVCTDDSLNVSIAKLYGPDLNEPGNFCISGHRGTAFMKLDTLKEGDTLYMIDKKTKRKVNYEVYKVYTCSPYDLTCLDQNDDGKREVTIITCTPNGAKRVVCKAYAT